MRSSRVPTGATTQDVEVDDGEIQAGRTSGTLNPAKAVWLQLALTQTKDPQQIQQIFNQYDHRPVRRGLFTSDSRPLPPLLP